MPVKFGTSGWSYPEWAGRFYVNNRIAKLPYYSSVFDSVEVDSSFYKPPSRSMVAGWAKATGSSFKFSFMLPSSLANSQQNARAERETRKFLDNLEPLVAAEKVGSLLLHVPHAFAFTELESLESRCEFLPHTFHLAVEFAHPSWKREETWRMLARHNVATVINDYHLPSTDPIFTASTHAYVRWLGLGKPDRRDYEYTEDELSAWLGRLREIEERVPVIYAYFCNHPGANAPANLLKFLEMRGPLSESQAKALRRYLRSQKKLVRRAELTEYF